MATGARICRDPGAISQLPITHRQWRTRAGGSLRGRGVLSASRPRPLRIWRTWTAIAKPIAGSSLETSESGLWAPVDVDTGDLAPRAFGALLDVLEPATDGQGCFHALWEGWGWVDRTGVRTPADGELR